MGAAPRSKPSGCYCARSAKTTLTRTPRCCRRPEVRVVLHLPDDVGREEAWLGMAQQLGQWELRGTGQWALEEKATGVFVGHAGMFFPERRDWPGIEIGWALHPDHWGNGYTTEAGAAAVEYAFAHHDVDELYSLILSENHRVAGRRPSPRLHPVARTRDEQPFPTSPT